VRVLRYTVDAAQQQVNLSQTLVGAFVEDRWRPTPALTVTAGLRWDYDDLTSRGASTPDLDNWQPRVAVNWVATPSTVVRAGAGRYAGKFPYAIYSDAVQFGPGGNQTVTFEGADVPRYLQGPRTATLDRATLPPGEVRELFALGLEQPMARQLTAGVQRQLGARAALSVDAVLVDTRNLPRSWDLNASTRGIGPADTVSLPVTAGDAFRPVRPVAGGYRRRTTSESGGRSRYAALQTALRWDAARAWTLDANWVWSRARNDTEDINFNATQGNRFDLEWADAVNDRRHKATTRLTVDGAAAHDARRHRRLPDRARRSTASPSSATSTARATPSATASSATRTASPACRATASGCRAPSCCTRARPSLCRRWRRRGAPCRGAARRRVQRAQLHPRDGLRQRDPRRRGAHAGGRPGDPIVLSSAGAPRQVQLSVRYAF
jgi:hypothetical protein